MLYFMLAVVSNLVEGRGRALVSVTRLPVAALNALHENNFLELAHRPMRHENSKRFVTLERPIVEDMLS